MRKRLSVFSLLRICIILLLAEAAHACDPPELSGSFILCSDQDAIIDAGPGFVSYQWSTGGSGQTESFSAPGDYSVTVTDASGCEAVATFEILAFTVRLELVSVPDGCGGGVVNYQVIAENIPEFPWFIRVRRDFEDGGTITNLYQSGIAHGTVIPVGVNTFQNATFTLLESFTSGCQAFILPPESFDVTIANLETAPEITGGPFVCVGSIPEPTELTVEPTFASYIWNTGETTQSILAASPGIYTVTVTDVNGCVGTADILLSGIGDLGFFVFGQTTICAGEEVLLQGFPPDEGPIVWSTGETGPSILVTEPGTYSATITRTCQDAASITISLIDEIDVEIVGGNELCEGGQLTLSTSESFSSYTWSNGSTDAQIDVTEPGTYSVTVSNASGCTGEAEIEIGLQEPDLLTILISGTICSEGDALQISVEGSFLEFNWSTGANSPVISVSESGTYSVTATDVNGCIGEGEIEVDVPLPFEVAISGENEICEGGSTILSLLGGPFSSIAWSTGQNTPEITVNIPGTYFVNVGNGSCQANASFEVSLIPSGDVQILGSSSICAGESAVLTANVSESATFSWSTGAVSDNITISTPGIYSVTATFDDGCTSEDVFLVELSILDAPIISAPISVCEGQIFELSVPDIYDAVTWSDGQTGASIIVDASGLYAVTVSLGSCEAFNSIEIVATDLFVVPILGVTVICDEPILLAVDDGFLEVNWSTGSSLSSIEVDAPGIYSVTVTDLTGCIGEGQVEVNLTDLQPPFIMGNNIFCPGVPIPISVDNDFLAINWNTGATDNLILVDDAGIYSVTVTNENGCTAENSIEISEGIIPDVSIEAAGALCTGNTVDLIATTSLDNPSFTWSTGTTDIGISVSIEGTYIVTVTDDFGCFNTASIDVFESAPPELVISGATSICPGQLSNLIAQGTAISFLWSTGETSDNIFISDPGTYSVTVSDGNGCTNSASISVNADSELVFSILGPSFICPGDEANLVVPGGFSSYTWSNGASSNTIVVGEPGEYSVTIVDVSGCSGSSTLNLTFFDTDGILIQTEGVLCEGGEINLFTEGDFSNLVWNTGEEGSSLLVSEPGMYSITGLDQNACEASGELLLELAANPSFTIEGDAGLCPDASGLIRVVIAADVQIIWENGTTDSTLEISEPGIYTATLSGENGCTVNVNVDIIAYENPEVQIQGPNSLCPGSEILLEVSSNGDAFVWSTGSTESSILIDSPGTYTVSVSNSNGCERIANIEIVESDTIEIQISQGAFNCAGFVVLSIDANLSDIVWSTGQSSTGIEVIDGGVYSVQAIDLSGCIGIGEIEVIIPEILTLELSSSPFFCPGESLQIVASEGFDTYEWSNGEESFVIEVSQPANYSVTATDSNGCEAQAEIQVSWFDLDILELETDGILCEGSSVTVSSAESYLNYLWSDGSAGTSAQVATAGFISLTVSDENGCVQLDSIWIENGLLTNASITPSGNLCDGEGVTLSVSAAEPIIDILWGDGSIEQALMVFSPGLFEVTVTSLDRCPQVLSFELNAANEFVEITTTLFSCEASEWGIDSIWVENINGCDTLFINEVLPGEIIWVELGQTPAPCPGEDYNIEIFIEGKADGILAINGQGFNLLEEFREGALSLDLSNLAPGVYNVSIVNPPNDACLLDSNTVLEVIDRTWTTELETQEVSDRSYLVSILSDRTLSSIQWEPTTTLSCLDCPQPIARPLSVETYRVRIVDGNGCEQLLEVSLSAPISSDPLEIFAPTAFSPNADGINDAWRLFANTPLRIISLKMFDRFGNLLWEHQDEDISATAAAWDGSRNGQSLMPGVYVWKARLESDDGREIIRSGHVHLVE